MSGTGAAAVAGREGLACGARGGYLACTRCISNLLRFLATLDIPIVGTLRESRDYIRGAGCRPGLHGMKSHRAALGAGP